MSVFESALNSKITVFTDHNPILFFSLPAKKTLHQRIQTQMFLTKFSNPRIIHTEGTNLTVTVVLSREFPITTNRMYQLQNKTLTNSFNLNQTTLQNKLNIWLNMKMFYPHTK